MREDLLYFIWQYGKLANLKLLTSQNEEVQIVRPGTLNTGEGPDFFNATLEIDGQTWAGNVEMHLKASDWYAHHHETDSNYDNVILHVVWEEDVPVFRKDNSIIPALELKDLISKDLLSSYQSLMDTSKSKFINCERDLKDVEHIVWKTWIERLYIERLEQKSMAIHELLKKSKNDWEAVLFQSLCKSFGSKINGASFLSRAQKLDFAIVRKVADNREQLESLLLGHFGLLNNVIKEDRYVQKLTREYQFLHKKFGLPENDESPAFYGLRPNNFPTIRISQLAGLYHQHRGLFQTLVSSKKMEEFYRILQVEASSYWEDHFTFGKISKHSKKRLSKSFIDLLLINTIVPLKFCYARHKGVICNEELMDIMVSIKPEVNTIISSFDSFGTSTENALESQAKLQLHQHYCTKNKCLQCAVGIHLLNRNTYF